MANNIKNQDFVYFDSEQKEHSIKIDKNDFDVIDINKNITDVKLESKPTTFFKDAMKRFVKNKSSVIGGIILGVIVLTAFVLPTTLSSDIANTHVDQRFLQPKLFSAGTGFWDGTTYYDTDIVYDTTNETPADFRKNAVTELVTWENTTNSASKYAYGGDLRLASSAVTGTNQTIEGNTKYLQSYAFNMNLAYDYDIKVNISNIDSKDEYENAKYRFYLKYNVLDTTNTVYFTQDYKSDYSEQDLSLSKFAKESIDDATYLTNVKFGVEILPSYTKSTQLFIKSIKLTTTDENNSELLSKISFDDANKQVLTTKVDDETKLDDPHFWASNGYKYLYQAKVTYCHFRYDSYIATYGDRDMNLSGDFIKTYIKNGWMSYDFTKGIDSFKVLDSDKCPINSIYKQNTSTGIITTYNFDCNVSYYKYLGYDKIPTYIFGTDSLGKDFIHIMFSGLRTSLILGLATTIINFIIGIIWGSISGYFGGWTDLLMERFTDILGRVPWIVVMTLCILYLGQNFLTFALALCLTGWMGVAGTTRAQFYRFKGREYVLASRTLGSSDVRLIFKHILPNSLGTLVTSSVFMIPSVIFTEASLSYLGLGLQGLDSFGVILSENQQYISSNSYLIIIPSIVMAFMMVSFNLFGNGLRDAFNPSLKGSE